LYGLRCLSVVVTRGCCSGTEVPILETGGGLRVQVVQGDALVLVVVLVALVSWSRSFTLGKAVGARI